MRESNQAASQMNSSTNQGEFNTKRVLDIMTINDGDDLALYLSDHMETKVIVDFYQTVPPDNKSSDNEKIVVIIQVFVKPWQAFFLTAKKRTVIIREVFRVTRMVPNMQDPDKFEIIVNFSV